MSKLYLKPQLTSNGFPTGTCLTLEQLQWIIEKIELQEAKKGYCEGTHVIIRDLERVVFTVDYYHDILIEDISEQRSDSCCIYLPSKDYRNNKVREIRYPLRYLKSFAKLIENQTKNKIYSSWDKETIVHYDSVGRIEYKIEVNSYGDIKVTECDCL